MNRYTARTHFAPAVAYNGRMGRLQDKHIVVTGASAGIGAELCRALGREGCRVVLAARRADLLEAVAQDVRSAGGRAEVVPTDVTDREAVQALAVRATEAFGAIDVWVNNAGMGIMHSVLDATEEDMLGMFRLNCLSSLYAYQAVLPGWLKRGYGQLIDICSLGGKAGYAYAGGYAAAKHAMSGLADSLRQELALTGALAGTGPHEKHSAGHEGRPSGIIVTTVYPGPTKSDFGKARLKRMASAGEAQAGMEIEKLRTNKSLIVRAIARSQPTDVVVRAIMHSMLRPVYTVYPHRFANIMVLLGNLAPGFVLRAMARVK
jgi:short-subunit dehydrogenase